MFVHVLLRIAFWHHVEYQFWLLVKLRCWRTFIIFDLLINFVFLNLFILLLKNIKVFASSINLLEFLFDRRFQLIKKVHWLRWLGCGRLRIGEELLLGWVYHWDVFIELYFDLGAWLLLLIVARAGCKGVGRRRTRIFLQVLQRVRDGIIGLVSFLFPLRVIAHNTGPRLSFIGTWFNILRRLWLSFIQGAILLSFLLLLSFVRCFVVSFYGGIGAGELA